MEIITIIVIVGVSSAFAFHVASGEKQWYDQYDEEQHIAARKEAGKQKVTAFADRVLPTRNSKYSK